MPFDALFSQSRHPSRNLAVNRNIGDTNLHGRCDKCSSFARMPIDETFSLERRDVLHDGSLACKTEMVLDFARTGRDAFFALLALDKIEDAPLPFRQHAGSIPSKFKLGKFK